MLHNIAKKRKRFYDTHQHNLTCGNKLRLLLPFTKSDDLTPSWRNQNQALLVLKSPPNSALFSPIKEGNHHLPCLLQSMQIAIRESNRALVRTSQLKMKTQTSWFLNHCSAIEPQDPVGARTGEGDNWEMQSQNLDWNANPPENRNIQQGPIWSARN